MNYRARNLSALLLCLAVVLGVCTVLLSFFAADHDPVLVKKPPEIQTAVTEFICTLQSGDLLEISSHLAENPDLGEQREPEDPVGRLLLQAYRQSLTLQSLGECYAQKNGIAVDGEISCLSLDSVFSSLKDPLSELLEKRIREASSPEELYNNHNEYQEELIEEVLGEGSWQCLQDHGEIKSQKVTFHFIYCDQQWKILPEEEILNLISGI